MGIVYDLVGATAEVSDHEVLTKLKESGLNEEKATRVMDLLLWYGFLGIRINSDDPKFIYDFSYNKALMDGVKRNSVQSVSLVINQAFWPGLLING